MGEIDHVRSEASGRSHVYFKSYKITNITKTLFCLGQPEELEMDEPAFHLEFLQRLTSVTAELFRNLRQHIIDCFRSVVYCVCNIDTHE